MKITREPTGTLEPVSRLQAPLRPSPVFLGIVALTIGGGALCLVRNEAAATAGVILLVLGGWVVSLCLHEFGHAIVAYRGGDYSVRAKGYLTLDPRRYTDPVLSIVLPIIFVMIGAIPLPGGAVWLNQGALRDRATRTRVSLAGPLANLVFGLLLTGVVALAVNTLTSGTTVVVLLSGLSFLAQLQILAFVLNILPIPGLDGWGAIEPYMSYRAQEFGMKARPWAPLILVAVLIGIPPVGSAFFGVADAVFGALGGEPLLAGYAQSLFFFWQSI